MPRVPARLVVLGAVAALGATGCSSSVEYGGQDVADPEAVVAALDSRFREDQNAQTVTTTEDSRCYLAEPDSGDSIDSTAYCGPIRHFGSTGPGVWDTYRLTASPAPGGEEEVNLSVAGPGNRGVVVPESINLFRPDGESPPDDAAELAAPPPPALESGYANLIEGQLVQNAPAPEAGGDALLITDSVTAVLVGSTVAETVDLPETGPRSAAEGEEFVIATLRIAGGPDMPQPDSTSIGRPTNASATTAAAIVGDKRYSINLPGATRGFGAVPLEPWDAAAGRAAIEGKSSVHTLVVSVPKGSGAALGLAAAGKEQTLDLRTGKRTNPVSGAYYRENLVAPVAASYPAKTQTVGDFTAQLGGYVDKVYLTAYDSQAGWAAPGRAFLVVPFQDLPRLNRSYNYTYRPNPAATSTLTSGETRFSRAPGAGVEQSAVFDVPEDFSQGEYVYRPTGTFSSESTFAKPRSGTFRAASALTIPIRLG